MNIVLEQYKKVHNQLVSEIRDVCTRLFYFDIFSHYLQESLGRVSLSIDVWSDEQLRSFLGVSAHWISHQKITCRLQLHSGMLAFRHFNGLHSGENMAHYLFELLKRCKLLHKVFAVIT
jgi:hypothetical protein